MAEDESPAAESPEEPQDGEGVVGEEGQPADEAEAPAADAALDAAAAADEGGDGGAEAEAAAAEDPGGGEADGEAGGEAAAAEEEAGGEAGEADAGDGADADSGRGPSPAADDEGTAEAEAEDGVAGEEEAADVAEAAGSTHGGTSQDGEEAESSRAASPEHNGEAEEGFGSEEEQEEAEEEAEQEPEDDTPNRMQELQEKLDQLVDLNERALLQNDRLQRRVIQRRMQDKSYDATDKQSEGKVTEHKYQNVLHNVHNVRLQLRLQQVKAARMSEELKNQLETKRQKAIECRDSFQEFKRQVAMHAEYARTGEKIPKKIIQEVEEFELDKDAEVEEVRGSNISLKNRLAKLEQLLRKKDELADNLHVIDFEQLKIENQTLNEKIEERNEELHKLRKKTITTVQIITHMREKVQFVQQDYQSLKAELAQLDQDLSGQRDLVAKTKHERDEHRSDSGKLRQQTSIMNSEHLTKDYEARTEQINQLKDHIGQLKRRHLQMTQFVKGHGGTV